MNRDRQFVILRTIGLLSIYGAGWIVANTILPGWTHGVVAAILASVPLVGLAVVASALGFELSGGQCRAETNSGERCSRGRPPNRDCCWQHRDLHGVTLHPDGVGER